eukprot:XP_014781870.1 PREDICTED: RING finger protein 11-like [Octopus bimaculoides]
MLEPVHICWCCVHRDVVDNVGERRDGGDEDGGRCNAVGWVLSGIVAGTGCVVWSVESVPVYHPSPNVSRPANLLTEEEQIKIAQRLGLINHLPTGVYDGTKKARECVICMVEFNIGDALRYLPCMHTYHRDCIDDWLMRSFTCPSCMEPVDAALLTTYETNQ